MSRTMRWRDASAAALFLALCGDAAAANIFHADGIDPRRFVDPGDPDQRRLAPVGAIASDFVLKDKRGFGGVAPGAGTAFLVSPCYALTNYHVLFGNRTLTPDPMSAYVVTVRFALADRDGRAITSPGRVRYAGSLDGSAPDVALVRLDGCPGRQLGWYDLAAAGTVDTLAATIDLPSYSHDRSLRRLSLQRGCGIRARAPRRGWLFHDCATREGASGAPMVVAGRDGVPLVAGINAAELQPTPGVRTAFDLRHANLAVDAAALVRMPLVLAAIERDRAGVRNPLAAD
ncbi:trypsin-like peptidase domain-containing protein [Sphingomonas sp.]|uniref:trypsin-like serine peptidase n=2 Tax=Sphingomonas TaxID=13687 RepID=UPI00286EE40D|nr:trypsin-like peptidase domain-containing protein [Sphingomonas sp.]